MSRTKKEDVRLSAKANRYFSWPLYLWVIPVLAAAMIYPLDKKSALIVLIAAGIQLAVSAVIYIFRKHGLEEELVHYAMGLSKATRLMLKELDLPYAILDGEGRFVWANDAFAEVVNAEKVTRFSVSEFFPEITRKSYPKEDAEAELHLAYGEQNYRVVLKRTMDSEAQEKAGAGRNRSEFVSMYLYDETEIMSLIHENESQRMIIGLIYIDNYDEAMESIDEVRRSLLSALIERKIAKSMSGIDAIIKKLEKDKYLIIFKSQYLEELEVSRFPLLDEVRAVNLGNEVAVTVSIGIGIEHSSYIQEYDFARAAIDLALGRGGDQTVIKEGENIRYYGGKSQSVEKQTRVKARVKAHALKELVEAKEQVFIMGHQIGDIDVLGAAVGIWRICQTLGTEAHIVLNTISTSLAPFVDRFKENQEYPDNLFVTGERAQSMVNEDTMLVVVDVNKPSYTECPELLESIGTIVVLDHHRAGSEVITNAVLSYVEPYASSACEMVAEVLQYTDAKVKLKPVEADAMYGGILVDTNNFQTKTGVRTFEAVAFLRRNGADITRVRKLFRTDMNEFKYKATAISTAEVFMDHYAFARCIGTGIPNPTILGAQVANELMDINQIRASFVFTPYQGKTYISARSIDEMNVQVVMEKIGGGGHMSVAGAQLAGTSVDEAVDIVKQVLTEMRENKEID